MLHQVSIEREGTEAPGAVATASREPSILDYYRRDDPDLFAKCRAFSGEAVQGMRERGLWERLYRVTVIGGLDHRIRVFNPVRGREEEMVCFDSNSYLGLHRHPRVLEAAAAAMAEVGYGTPSAQVLCGTSRHLRELEEAICRFHGREAAMVFPTGYGANVGTLTALLRRDDLAARDRFCHASIHDGIKAAGTRHGFVYPHRDLAALDAWLSRPRDPRQGAMVATDGVFSMHGDLADLPGLVAVARRRGARLLVDEAHSTGILGPHGRGLEDHFGLPGSVDVLVGTCSKALGTTGGYVCAPREVVEYLRFFAHAGLFTAAPPAHLCAGLVAAFRVLEEEPWHREALWRNVRAFVPALERAGLVVSGAESPIVTVFVGSTRLLWAWSRRLFDAGVKCGTVAYPAVPPDKAILRLAVNARHTPEDLGRAVEVLGELAAEFGVAGKTPAEIGAIGDALPGEVLQ